MHELFSLVLNGKDLSKAGDLFSVPDDLFGNDLNEVLRKINEIASSPSYITNENTQSVVEISLARVISIIREMQTIEKHVTSLVSLLVTCLNNDLKVDRDDPSKTPPHKNVFYSIASDVLACLFLNYKEEKVMRQTLAVAVKFLFKGNPNLLRNISSYLPLAAIEFPELLAKHSQIILSSVISGNYTLARVLPQIYPLSQDRINEHVLALAQLLCDTHCDDLEKIALLNLFVSIGESYPYLLEPCLPQLSSCLNHRSTAFSSLQVFYAMSKRSNLISDYLDKIEKIGSSGSVGLASDIIAEIGLHNKAKSYQAICIHLKYLNNFKEAQIQGKLIKNFTRLIEVNEDLITEDLIFDVGRYRGLSENLRLLKMKRDSRNLRPISLTPLNAKNQHKSLTRLNYKSNIKYGPPYVSQLTIKSSGSLLQDSTYSINVPFNNSYTPVKKHQSLSSSLNEANVLKSLPPTTPVKESIPATAENNRISVFEPFAIRDTIQHFCEKHLDKIKSYIDKIMAILPLPVKVTIEERKSKKNAKLHFSCSIISPHCIYSSNLFTLKTSHARIWIHLMFLTLQARRSNTALSTKESSVSSLKNCWDVLKSENKSFLTVVTSAFPSTSDQELLIKELRQAGFLDIFEYKSVCHNPVWGCFLCHNPEKAIEFLELENRPVIEGQLKEKKGKWRLFRRWRTRYFTLSGGTLSCGDNSTLSLNQIRSVRVSRSSRNIPKAFEIFTDENSYILKPKDGKGAEEWVQCLSVLVGKAKVGKCVSLSGLRSVGST